MDKLEFKDNLVDNVRISSKLFGIGYNFSLTYSNYLFKFNNPNEKSSWVSYDYYLPLLNYHPIPLTYTQWLSITNELALLISLMKEDAAKEIEIFNLFWILFIKLDPNHQKMSINEVLLYYLAL